MFDENKKHGFVVVEYTGESHTYLKMGNEYEGFISSTGSAIVFNDLNTLESIEEGYYKIIHDLRAPVKIGEEAEFSSDGEEWTKRWYGGAILYYSTIKHRSSSGFNWRKIRPIQNPDIKIKVEINGKEANLSDISEETLIKLRNEN